MTLKSNNKNHLIIGIGALVLVVVFALVWMFSSEERKFDWSEEYKYNTEQPYDNNLLFALLQERAVEDSFFMVKTALSKGFSPSTINTTASYVYVGGNSNYSYNDIDSLLVFVENGHDAFLSVNYLDLDLAHQLNLLRCEIPVLFEDTIEPIADSLALDEEWDKEEYEEYEDYEEYAEDTNVLSTIEYDMLDSLLFSYADTAATLNLLHPTLALKNAPNYIYRPNNKTDSYNWSYFNFEGWCGGDTAVAKLGTVSTGYNFIRVPYGQGHFYIHTTPIAFTNYYLRDDDKLSYAQNVFSHLPDGAIYWDEGSHYFHSQDENDGGSNPFGKSELNYILSQQASKWAFYTLLVGILLYIIFYMKRRQRIIAVIEPYENTSIEYVQSIGALYFMKKEHRRLAEQKFKLFLSYLRNRYRIPTQVIDDAFIKKVAATSKVEEQQVRKVIESYQEIETKMHMNEEQLIRFNNHLEYFYKYCK